MDASYLRKLGRLYGFNKKTGTALAVRNATPKEESAILRDLAQALIDGGALNLGQGYSMLRKLDVIERHLADRNIETAAGCIIVDERMATNIPGVFAVGDVTGKLPLAHVASAQAVVAVEHIAGLEPQALDYAMMPRATYCQPQVASFGLTEAQARAQTEEQGHGVQIGTFNVQANGKALAMGESEGMIKLVVDDKYGELLGGHMIGPEVTELLGELAMTKLLEGTVLELGWAGHPHPSLSEMLKEAALSAQGRVIHM